MNEDRNFVTALARGLSVLRCFTAQRPELGTTDIARLTGMSQSTAWRLCYTLQKAGYLTAGKDPERLTVTPAVLSLGCEAVCEAGLVEAAMPRIRQIADQFRCCVSIAAYDRLEMVIVARAAAHAALRLDLSVGSRLRVDRSAIGCAYLVGLDEAPRTAVLKEVYAAYPRERRKAQQHMAESLRTYQQHGYVLNLGQYHPAVNAIGVPIVSVDRKTVLGMNCGGASTVMTPELLSGPAATVMKSLANDLSLLLRAG
jgi:DNA-binding IclR family transcriptional regulator